MECTRCGTCCVAPDIAALDKPVGVRCPHLGTELLCSIYERRPGICRSYAADWLCEEISAPTLSERVARYHQIFQIVDEAEEVRRRGFQSMREARAWADPLPSCRGSSYTERPGRRRTSMGAGGVGNDPGPAARFFAGLPQHSMRLGLERIEAALEALGRPQERFPALLVAGTNGKGSTCSFIHAALLRTRESGKVGLYTSPHLVSFRERIRIGAGPVPEGALDDAVARLLSSYPAAKDPAGPDGLSFFEAATAVAFDLFARSGVEVAVLEVGLGGRLDATNVPGTRLVATAVTRLGLDHVEHLGGTLAAIAGEKAAIARPGVPMISAPLDPEARGVIEASTRKVGAPLYEVGRELAIEENPSGLRYVGPRWRIEGISVGLKGAHQLENAAVALGVLEAAEKTLGVGPAAAREGVAAARWPGRLEVVRERPLVLLDGAHNPDGAHALAAAMRSLWPNARPEIVFGVLGDKDRREMIRAIAPLGAAVHICEPPSPRAVPAAEVAADVRSLGGVEVMVHPSIERAVEVALAQAGADGTVLICGSLYLIGEARRLFWGDRPAV